MEYLSDLIEKSLTLVDESGGVEDAVFCETAAALYALEGQYHHTSTVFRLRDLLVRRGYLVEVPVEEHPAYEKLEASVEEAGERDPGAPIPVTEEPTEPWEAEKNPVVGYVLGDDLIVEVGSSLWERLIEDETIDGDGESLEEDPAAFDQLVQAVERVVETASQESETDVLLGWHAALGFHVTRRGGAEGVDDASELTDHDGLQRIRGQVLEIDDLGMKLADPRSDYDLPPRELRKMHPFLGWWYEGVGV